MTLTQQWWYVNLTRNSYGCAHLFSAQGIKSYRQINSKRLCFSVKRTCTTVNELNNINVNYLKIPQKHRGPHKTPSRVACLQGRNDWGTRGAQFPVCRVPMGTPNVCGVAKKSK